LILTSGSTTSIIGVAFSTNGIQPFCFPLEEGALDNNCRSRRCIDKVRSSVVLPAAMSY
jgi:hypothetical protein